MAKKWNIAVDLLKEVYGTLQMFVFILEESTQSIGMSTYLSFQAGDMQATSELSHYALDEIINPALDWLDDFGYLIWPNDLSYKEFFLASKKSMERYLELAA